MIEVRILEGNKNYLIKEIRYKKPHFNGMFEDTIEIIAYFDENNTRKGGGINAE
jgi:hypothetical protein